MFNWTNIVSSYLKVLGNGFNEVLIDIKLSISDINSIEYTSKGDIVLHKFEDDLDYEIDFNDLSESDKILILNKLKECKIELGLMD